MIRMNKNLAADQKTTKNNSEFPHAGTNKKEDHMKHFTFKTLAMMLALLMLFASCSRTSSPKARRVESNLNSGELVSGSLRQTVKPGESVAAHAAANGNMTLSSDSRLSTATNDTVVNAVWSDNTCTVTFDPCVPGLPAKTVTVSAGSSVNAPVFEREGWDFMGWDQDISKVTADMTVHANWDRHPMTPVEIGEYADSRVVTVHTDIGTGTGFFIDDQGTLVTNYHVIEYATSIYVTMTDGAIYPVNRVINFAEKYDIAILHAEISGNKYFEMTDNITKGENVYAIGCPLGFLQDTLTSGIISATSREIGLIDCIQTNADITDGNSGGPLLNQYGEVIGINSYGFNVNGASGLNLAIKIKMLGQLDEAVNFTLPDYVEWWKMQQEQSYYFTSIQDTNKFNYSIVNTYQSVTGMPCIASADSIYPSEDITIVPDYYRWLWVYIYEYTENEYKAYIDYLKDIGFVYEPDLSDKDATGSINVYYSQSMQLYMQVCVTNELSDWGGAYVLICPCY